MKKAFRCRKETQAQPNNHGFTLIELMIVIAVIAIILALALPTYASYTIRSKIAESLSVGAAAKTAVTGTCNDDPLIAALSNNLAAYQFTNNPLDTSFVGSIEASGPCSDPVITISTKNTGATPDPIIILTGFMTPASPFFTWTCTASAPSRFLPEICRS